MAEVKNFRLAKKFIPQSIVLPVVEEPEGWDEDIVETAGFVPLEVRFKQMEQAGFRAQFFESEFSSKDVTDMYLNHPEFDITPEDEIEEAYEKMMLRAAYIESVKRQVQAKKAASEDQKEESADRTADKKAKSENDKNEA